MNSNFSRNLALWVIIGLFMIVLFNLFQGPRGASTGQAVEYSQFVTGVKEGRVTEVEIRDNIISGKFSDGRKFTTFKPDDVNFANQLSLQGVRVTATPREEGSSFLHILLSWVPMLLLIGVWIFFLKQMQSGSNRAMGFGKSRAKELSEDGRRVTFADVAGVEEAKADVQEVVDFLRDPRKFQKLGAKIPKGILLMGPPGTGKTLLARAIAGEANVPFFTISGSDFVEMFVGVGASRVRDMFEQAKKKAPCIVFVDEIDAVGRHRGAGLGGGNDEREQTLNQLLVEMDGFDNETCVILIAATNRPDVLDPALLRPGRFDRQIVVPVPDVAGREEILGIHAAKVPLAPDVDLKTIARGTPGFSGADLENLVNEAALLAARRNRRTVSMREFDESKDKILMGSERKSLAMTEEEKKLTAYHEAGHAVVAFHSPASDPIHKATIVPRGRALGMVVRLPEGDRISLPLKKIKADLAVAMGGRVAEEMIFGPEQVTTGASSDIKFVTDMARRAVTEWGLSEKLGPVQYGAPESQEVFLGHSVTQSRNMSEQTAQLVDSEIKAMADAAYQTARKILQDKRDQLETLAKALLEHETLTGEQITQLLNGQPLEIESEKSSKQKSTKKKPISTVPVLDEEEAESSSPLKPDPQPEI